MTNQKREIHADDDYLARQSRLRWEFLEKYSEKLADPTTADHHRVRLRFHLFSDHLTAWITDYSRGEPIGELTGRFAPVLEDFLNYINEPARDP